MMIDDAPLRGPYHDWYETWRAQQDGRRQAKIAAQDRLNRQVRWLTWFIVGYAVFLSCMTGSAIWWLT